MYRNPDHLPRVLLNLLRHPGLSGLLFDQKTLATYLQTQGWAELPEAKEAAEEAEEAELMLEVEKALESKDLSPAQMRNLREGLIQTCPECQGMIAVLMPDLAHAQN